MSDNYEVKFIEGNPGFSAHLLVHADVGMRRTRHFWSKEGGVSVINMEKDKGGLSDDEALLMIEKLEAFDLPETREEGQALRRNTKSLAR